MLEWKHTERRHRAISGDVEKYGDQYDLRVGSSRVWIVNTHIYNKGKWTIGSTSLFPDKYTNLTHANDAKNLAECMIRKEITAMVADMEMNNV